MISLRHKIWLGFGTLLVILLLVSCLTAIVLTRYSHTLERVFRENYDSVTYSDQMKKAADQLNLRCLLLIWQPGQPTNIDLAAQSALFEKNLNLEFGNITLKGEGEHAGALRDLWVKYQEELKTFETAGADRQALYSQKLLPTFREIHETAQWIADANISNMVSVDGQVKRTLVEVRTALLVLSFAGTLAAALVVGAAGRSILHPLRNLMRGAQQIESGDLDLNLPVRSRDEIGALAEAFNSMAAKLREFRRIDHERLVRMQQTTQLAIDSLPDAVFIIGPDGTVEISNRSAAAHFGISPGSSVQDLQAKVKWLGSLYESVKRNDAQPAKEGYSSAIQHFEDGQERFLLPRAVPMLSVEGGVIGVCIILVDVTPLRLADEAKSDLVSTVSHELRTPLTSIRMAMSLLTNPKFGLLTPKQSTLLEAARQDSDRLYRIIENLLNISRIESGRAEFHFQPAAAAQIIQTAVEGLGPALVEKRLNLRTSIQAVMPEVLVDLPAIGSALTNLLSNAIKYTPAGGQIEVAAGTTATHAVFSVGDSGPGIPAEYAGRIFEKFFRIPESGGPSGAGLGLAIAKEIIEAHGGTLELARDRKVGSEFRFTLRLAPAPAQSPAGDAAHAEPGEAGSIRIIPG
jgi:signal transduction histidine kinase